MSRPMLAALACAFSFVVAPLVAQAQPQGTRLPEGAGKELVEAVCTACHQTNQITGSTGYTQAEWRELTGTMVDLSHVPDQWDTITKYLAANFPPNTKRKPNLVPGEFKIAFKEWKVPTLGQRARDPVEAADGTIWWAGQFGNVIGQINPKTDEMKEYQLPAGAKPHTVSLDDAGNVWYTGNSNGTVGKLDPKTGKITEYKMPDPAAKDPHTIAFDKNGTMWFTLQQSNMVGRLFPQTGEIDLKTMPIPRSNPYGIKIDARGQPIFACNGSNCIVKVDPKTMELTLTKLPIPETTVRRLDIAPDGLVWYVNSSQGRIGRYNPETGDIKEWPSPSGKDSHPYGLAVVDGVVWYNESGMRPDALVRFDPKTEKFQSWPIPSGGVYAGIVRNMRPTRDGNLLIHQSSTNRIILVTLK